MLLSAKWMSWIYYCWSKVETTGRLLTQYALPTWGNNLSLLKPCNRACNGKIEKHQNNVMKVLGYRITWRVLSLLKYFLRGRPMKIVLGLKLQLFSTFFFFKEETYCLAQNLVYINNDLLITYCSFEPYFRAISVILDFNLVNSI